jgi:hypothetical protein
VRGTDDALQQAGILVRGYCGSSFVHSHAEPLNTEAAIDGLEARKQHIDDQIAELRAMITSAPVAGGGVGKRKFSPAARRRMREAQQRRWAKVKSESATPSVAKASRPKRRLSAAGREAIVDALKKRWAANKAAAGSGTSSAKKTARKG